MLEINSHTYKQLQLFYYIRGCWMKIKREQPSRRFIIRERDTNSLEIYDLLEKSRECVVCSREERNQQQHKSCVSICFVSGFISFPIYSDQFFIVVASCIFFYATTKPDYPHYDLRLDSVAFSLFCLFFVSVSLKTSTSKPMWGTTKIYLILKLCHILQSESV
jgi:hypothetical protein